MAALDYAAQAQDAAWQERFRHIKIYGRAVIDGARACNCLNRKTYVHFAAEHFNLRALKTQCAAVEGAPDLPMNCSEYLKIAQRADVALEALHARGKVDMARREAFFPRSLNHTLASIQAARRLHGFKPESTILLGPTAPVPGCERFHAPIDQSTVTYAFAEPESDDPESRADSALLDDEFDLDDEDSDSKAPLQDSVIESSQEQGATMSDFM